MGRSTPPHAASAQPGAPPALAHARRPTGRLPCSSPRTGPPSARSSRSCANDPESVYGDLLPVLRRADLRIVNCECALTSATSPVWKSGAVFKGDAGARGGPDGGAVRRGVPGQQPRAGLRRRRPPRDLRVLARARHPDRRRRAHGGAGARAAQRARQRSGDPHRQHQRRRRPDGLNRRPRRVRVGRRRWPPRRPER